MKNYGRTFVQTAYVLGATVTVMLFAVFLARADCVPFPDAMLPVPLWELARDCLAVGTPPMALAAWVMVRSIDAKEKKLRVLLFLPVLPCFGSLLLLGTVWLMGLVFSLLFWQNIKMICLVGLLLAVLTAVVVYSVKNIRRGRWKRALLVIGAYFLAMLAPYFVLVIRLFVAPM